MFAHNNDLARASVIGCCSLLFVAGGGEVKNILAMLIGRLLRIILA